MPTLANPKARQHHWLPRKINRLNLNVQDAFNLTWLSGSLFRWRSLGRVNQIKRGTLEIYHDRPQTAYCRPCVETSYPKSNNRFSIWFTSPASWVYIDATTRWDIVAYYSLHNVSRTPGEARTFWFPVCYLWFCKGTGAHHQLCTYTTSSVVLNRYVEWKLNQQLVLIIQSYLDHARRSNASILPYHYRAYRLPPKRPDLTVNHTRFRIVVDRYARLGLDCFDSIRARTEH